MTPEDITVVDIVKFVGVLGAAIIGYFMKRELDKVGVDLAAKADKDHMQREIEGLKMELKETRDARQRDMERLERTNAEKFAEFSASVRDRLGTMERNVDAKLDAMSRSVDGKLDMIVDIIKSLRQEK